MGIRMKVVDMYNIGVTLFVVCYTRNFFILPLSC